MKKLYDQALHYSIALFYFVLGFVFVFPSVNIWLLLKERTGLDPGRLAMQMQIADIPWLLKPLYAWMSDRLPIGGYRRKSYVGIFSFLCAVCWLFMPISLGNLVIFYIVWGVENLCLCVADVVVDALVVERTKHQEEGENKGSLQSISATCRSFGKCVGSLAGAFMFAEGASSKEMFYITSLAPFCVAVASFWIYEQKTAHEPLDDGPSESWGFYFKNMIKGFVGTDLWKFCTVATLYTMAPNPGAAYFYYYQDIMHVADFQLQMIAFAAELGLLVGNFIFVTKLRKSSPRKMMTTATMMVSGLIMWHAVLIFLMPFSTAAKLPLIYAYEFAIAMSDVLLFMPLFVMGAQLVTDGVEGTSYALVLSIQNLGGFLDNFIAAQIMNLLGISEGKMDHLWYMSFLCAFFFLVPLTMLHLLPESVIIQQPSKKE